jgi:hypothetical protein
VFDVDGTDRCRSSWPRSRLALGLSAARDAGRRGVLAPAAPARRRPRRRVVLTSTRRRTRGPAPRLTRARQRRLARRAAPRRPACWTVTAQIPSPTPRTKRRWNASDDTRSTSAGKGPRLESRLGRSLRRPAAARLAMKADAHTTLTLPAALHRDRAARSTTRPCCTRGRRPSRRPATRNTHRSKPAPLRALRSRRERRQRRPRRLWADQGARADASALGPGAGRRRATLLRPSPCTSARLARNVAAQHSRSCAKIPRRRREVISTSTAPRCAASGAERGPLRLVARRPAPP